MPNHPPQVTAISNSATRRDGQSDSGHFPVFTKDGRKTGVGIVTCATCHNPHQWSAAKAEEGPGKNTEGTNLNSFLRSSSEFSLCTNCHGLDALFRYKYFHAKSSRVK